MKVLILCTGNSCRSQMAHGILKSLDSELSVFSAGTRPVEKVNSKAVAVMREIGIDISDHTPHNVAEYLKEPWDYVVTVCGGAKESCPMFTGNVRHRLHIGFDDPSDAEGSIFEKCQALRELHSKSFMSYFWSAVLIRNQFLLISH